MDRVRWLADPDSAGERGHDGTVIDGDIAFGVDPVAVQGGVVGRRDRVTEVAVVTVAIESRVSVEQRRHHRAAELLDVRPRERLTHSPPHLPKHAAPLAPPARNGVVQIEKAKYLAERSWRHNIALLQRQSWNRLPGADADPRTEPEVRGCEDEGRDHADRTLRVPQASSPPVSDPCLGSRSAAVAALRRGRGFVGCDEDPGASAIARTGLSGKAWLPLPAAA